MTYYPAAYGASVPQAAPEGANRNGNGKPELGQRTPTQDVLNYYSRAFGWDNACANGGTSANPCGFPAYGGLYRGTYDTYRFMLDHPRIRHARAQVFNAIKLADWGWEVREGTPDEWLNLIRDMFNDQRAAILDHALRALDYGWAAFEMVWEVREGRYWLVENKPLSVDRNTILIEKDTGRFAGVRYGPNEDWLDLQKCWLFTYDGEAGHLYGRSRLENMRSTAWRDWLDTSTHLYWLSYKIAGKLVIITTPGGTFTNEDGSTVNWKDNADAVAQALRNPLSSNVIWFPSVAISDNRDTENLELAKVSLVNVDVKDFGNHAPAILGMLERMKHDEDLMFAGYLRSARTGMQSEHGSRADAQEHTETDTSDPELVAADITRTFNKGPVDAALALNFGEAARGAVYAKSAKMRDENRVWDEKILDAVLQDESMRGQLLEQLDIDAIAERRGIPKKGKMIDVIDESDAQGDNVDDGETETQTQAQDQAQAA